MVMARAPLGEVCVELKLMTPAEVDRVLRKLRDSQGHRFGEVAKMLGFLDESAIARAVAHQFRLQVVAEERLARLTVPKETLDLLSYDLVRSSQVLPTYYDADRKILSLITSDPTNVPALRKAQEEAGAERMRLFVGPSGALAKLIDRLLPEKTDDEDESDTTRTGLIVRSAMEESTEGTGRTIILEPDLEMVGALRSLDAAEGEDCEYAHDPDQVSILLETGAFDRVFYRTELKAIAEAYRSGWRRQRPGLLVTEVEGFSPSRRPAVPYRAAKDFYQQLAQFLLLASENKNMQIRAKVRRTTGLAKRVATELRIPMEQRDTLVLAALFSELESMSVVQGLVSDEITDKKKVRRFELALAMLRPMDPPYDLESLYSALERRLTTDILHSGHMPAEILFTVRAIVSQGLSAETDAGRLLGDRAARHDPQVLDAVTAVLRRDVLRGRLAQAEAAAMATRTIVLAERDGALTTAIEARLGQLGYEVVLAADGIAALESARTFIPAAVIANLRLPRKDGFSLLLDLKRDEMTKDIPVLLISNRASSLDVARGIELGAEEVLEKPVNLNVLIARLKRAVARNTHGQTSTASMTGQLADLSLTDLIQTLYMADKTAKISTVGPTGSGAVHLIDGRIVSANWADLRGEQALDLLMAMKQGRFEVRLGEKPLTVNIEGETDYILLEAMRRLDESVRRG
jgi:CheY-like chemotaxis protein